MDMATDGAVLYSFGLYVLYVLLPIIPAVVIFKLFPDTKVAVSGPFQNLTIKATGAFGAYVATVALGFFLVKNIERQINESRSYAFEGVIVDVGPNQYINSDRFYSRYMTAADAASTFQTRNYYFVLLLNHPVYRPERVWIKYWEINEAGGTGAPPAPRDIPMELVSTDSIPQRFRLRTRDNQLIVEPEAKITALPSTSPQTRN
jgi:hypothetical protein